MQSRPPSSTRDVPRVATARQPEGRHDARSKWIIGAIVIAAVAGAVALITRFRRKSRGAGDQQGPAATMSRARNVGSRAPFRWISATGHWLSVVHYEAIGRRFIVTAFVFFIIAGADALVMRTQLARPSNDLVGPGTYNSLFSVHGTVMVLGVALPIALGLSMYLVPSMIGARELPFPRLGAFSYWAFLFGALFLESSIFLQDIVPRSILEFAQQHLAFTLPLVPEGVVIGPPLASEFYSPETDVDYWLIGTVFIAVAMLVSAVQIVGTILKLRAPGMPLKTMPLFVWNALILAVFAVVTLPPLIVANTLLQLQRLFDLPVYVAEFGGDVLLWQHLFGLFGYPDPHILLLPALGIVATIISALSGRAIPGYRYLVAASIALGVLSLGIWKTVADYLPPRSIVDTVLAAVQGAVGIPIGMYLVALVLVILGGRRRMTVAMMFVAGFLFLFVVTLVSSLASAAAPVATEMRDTYVLVASIHFVLVGTGMFPIYAALYFWYPSITGRYLDEPLGVLHFWLQFVGFNLTFLPMFVVGLLNMPSRVYTYDPESGWELWNLLSTSGAYILAGGSLLFLFNAAKSFWWGKPAADDPWHIGERRWSAILPSVYPDVRTEKPVPPSMTDRPWEGAEEQPPAEVVATSVVESKPEEVFQPAGNSYSPVLLAFGLGLIAGGTLLELAWVAVAGLVIGIMATIVWIWPLGRRDDDAEDEVPHARDRYGDTASAWAMILLICVVGVFFASLLVSFVYLNQSLRSWSDIAYDSISSLAVVVASVLLLGSAGSSFFVRRAMAEGGTRLKFLLALTLVLGLAFVAVEAVALYQSDADWRNSASDAIALILLCFQLGVAIVGLLMLGVTATQAAIGGFSHAHRQPIVNTVLFWYSVAVITLIVLVMVYVVPAVI